VLHAREKALAQGAGLIIEDFVAFFVGARLCPTPSRVVGLGWVALAWVIH